MQLPPLDPALGGLGQGQGQGPGRYQPSIYDSVPSVPPPGSIPPGVPPGIPPGQGHAPGSSGPTHLGHPNASPHGVHPGPPALFNAHQNPGTAADHGAHHILPPPSSLPMGYDYYDPSWGAPGGPGGYPLPPPQPAEYLPSWYMPPVPGPSSSSHGHGHHAGHPGHPGNGFAPSGTNSPFAPQGPFSRSSLSHVPSPPVDPRFEDGMGGQGNGTGHGAGNGYGMGSSPTAGPKGKKKRRKTDREASSASGDMERPPGSAMGMGGGVGAGVGMMSAMTAGQMRDGQAERDAKRTKTGRACDACRTKKIRCDILASDDSPICAHCKQYNLECTFFLPITETRFKKKRAVETTDETPPPRPPSEIPARLEGPTSLSFLLHTSLPASASEAYDLRHHHMWEISDNGNGIIRVKAPPHARDDDETAAAAASGTPNPKSGSKLNRAVLNAQTISSLVNAYFDHQAHLFPIISRAEFAATSNPAPLLLYSLCGIGSTRRDFPRELFSGVRGVINGLLRSNDILSDARLENVQALLILSQVGDLNAQPTAATASACLMRTASAIRMAQDLGLHRESHTRAQTPQDLAFVELRRRVWATCVIMDRWYGAALGAPLLVDLLDCDVLLPAGYEILPDQEPARWPIDPSFVAITEHLKLSILVGRVLKTIYSPTGLKHATDEQLYTLLEDMRSWHLNLPTIVKFTGPDSSQTAGLLHLAYAALHFLFWRPFMRITYICPSHLKFALEVMHWSDMARWATESLEWLSTHDEVLDTLFVFPYTATSCALIQYHTWVRRREPAALESLKLVRETALRWEAAVQPDQMSIRRKTCETMTLLFEAALRTNPEGGDEQPPAINPTAGVRMRQRPATAVWVKDDAHEHGGIWVVKDEQEKADSTLPRNSVITESDVGKERLPMELESTHPAIRARALKKHSGSVVTEASVGIVGHPGEDGSGSAQGGGSGPGTVGSGTVGSAEEVPTMAQLQGPAQVQPQGVQGTGQEGVRDAGADAEARTHAQAQAVGDDAMRFLADMQMSASNVNPQLNDGMFDGGVQMSGQMANIYEPGVMNDLAPHGLDFNSWNQWFSSIDRMPPLDPAFMAGGMGGVGGLGGVGMDSGMPGAGGAGLMGGGNGNGSGSGGGSGQGQGQGAHRGVADGAGAGSDQGQRPGSGWGQ